MLLGIYLIVAFVRTKSQMVRRKRSDKHKRTNVGRIALERQARQFNSGAVA